MTGPAGQPPLDALPPDAPATVEDVRASRRWTWVALAWAIAASAIAVIALVQDNNNNNNSSDNGQTQTTGSVTPQQFQDFQKQVNDRLDAFSRRLNDTASSSDIQKLDKRLTTVEGNLSKSQDGETKQNDAITQVQSDVKNLQNDVKNLQQQQQQSQTGTSTTP